MKTLFVMIVAALLYATVARAGEQLALGANAPAFSLVSAADGTTVEMKPNDGFIKVVVFTSNGCPVSTDFEPRLIEIANRYGHRGIRFYAVNSSDPVRNHDESLQAMKARAEELEYPFPYLKDTNGSVAAAYGAHVTPHVFVVDGDGKVRYRGAIDDSAKPAERKVTGLTNALNGLTDGREVGTPDTVAFGCPIPSKN